MKLLKNYYKIGANSILESVIALSIISICLFITLIIYSSVFSPKTSIKKYIVRNRANEYFYTIQIAPDSVLRNTETDWVIKNNNSGEYLIRYSDKYGIYVDNNFYINTSSYE